MHNIVLNFAVLWIMSSSCHYCSFVSPPTSPLRAHLVSFVIKAILKNIHIMNDRSFLVPVI
jgi:hypothetical protein